MGDQNNSPAFFMLLPQKVKNQLAVFTVQVARRFIGKDQTWVQDEGSGNGNPLLFAAREGGDLLVQKRGNVQKLYQAVQGLLPVPPVVEGGEQNVLPTAQGRDEVVGLEDKANVL